MSHGLLKTVMESRDLVSVSKVSGLVSVSSLLSCDFEYCNDIA